ncbi:MAG: peptide-methionine (S)-S-oxide reductase [Chitinophagales bacterium]|jgi:peptide-methionine (S)-S-oxide reductase
MSNSFLMLLFLSITLQVNAKQGKDNLETITLGAGCFWCVEAVYQELNGVETAVSGYMGGHVDDPSYKAVCAGNTGHAEVVQLTFDNSIISLEEILEVFFEVHDPTTLNRQGADIGTQYRSAIFYENDEQKEIALKVKRALSVAKVWENAIVTEVSSASTFYKAENYHQDYYALNGNNNPYCSKVITPKIEKFRKVFEEKLK